MDNSFVIKTTVLGNAGVGKSAIINAINGEDFNVNLTSTVGVDFICLKKQRPNITYKFFIYDLAGQEAYFSITTSYFRDAKIALVVYDLNNLDSFKKLSYWESEFDKNNREENPLKIFVGNKCELKSIDNSPLVNQLEKRGIKHIEISAKENINIKVLEKLFTDNYINNNLNYNEVIEKININTIPNIKIESDYYIKLDDTKKNKNNCC